MNRKIKFRGLDENNEWVYGDHVRLILGGNIHYYIQPLDSKRISIIYESIGQKTGLKDKNEKEIYEGDIVVYSNDGTKAKVIFKEGGFIGYNGYASDSDEAELLLIDRNKAPFEDVFEVEIIGNIHENKNLLE